MQRSRLGFTLIELIIGITILSLLAVALLASLDPVEQFNKARDTATRNTAMELHNAIIRYNAATDSLPIISPIHNITRIPTVVAELVTAGELKKNFYNSAQSSLNQIAIFNYDNSLSTLKTCYRPKSKQFLKQKSMYEIVTMPDQQYLIPTSAFQLSIAVNGCSVGAVNAGYCLWCAQ